MKNRRGGARARNEGNMEGPIINKIILYLWVGPTNTINYLMRLLGRYK